jgi:hypothetical protein
MISGKKLSGIKVPDIKLTIEFFIKFAPQRFFKMNAEKPKHKLRVPLKTYEKRYNRLKIS